MAKSKTVLLTLRRNRDTAFRRTVTIGKDGATKQLVFEPGVDLELTEEMAKQVQDLIDTGMIVSADRDAKGRLRVSRSAVAIDNSEEVEALKARIAELEQQVKEYDELLNAADDDEEEDDDDDE